jgi:beta-ribofuranosylaminobenzene 5'-phosphate synthase
VTAVCVRAPARLHLGMLDPAGGGPRRFGGLGVGVSRPAVVVRAAPAAELSATGPGADRALAVARRASAALGLEGGVRLELEEGVPAHVGLGSGTKLALAVTAALAALAGRELGPEPLVAAAGRGARSAVGLWTFALGGLVVEGGRRDDEDRPAPLLARLAMPEAWRCVLVVPRAEPGLSGGAETEAFAALRPAGERSALIAQLVLTALLPALVEEDVTAFGGALTEIQRLVGESFASAQGGTYHPRAAALVAALLGGGAAGAGQTSWGPAVYGVVGGEAAGRAVADAVRPAAGPGALVDVVTFDNAGARIEGS